MADGIVWEDPPPKKSGPSTEERHNALHENPGRWMVWHTSPSAHSAACLASTLKKTHGYDTMSRGVKVYARYVERARL